ncbi:MAG: hypothetical protein M0Z45_07415 [Actinomycetota bacterium]|nr:hypothetical protein [Actinomycetota bacterium]
MAKVDLEQRLTVEDLSKLSFKGKGYITFPNTSLVISVESIQYASSNESWG